MSVSFAALRGGIREVITAESVKKRVLVVDDSALMRKFITEILQSAPDLEVIGTARDGVEALAKARSLRPDVITLDVEMPNMNGIAFLDALMPTLPIPVVMLSSLTTAGAEITLECLQRGAVDFAAKPSGAISLDLADMGAEIIKKTRGAASARLLTPQPILSPPFLSPAAPKSASLATTANLAFPATTAKEMDFSSLVIIAASTGGPTALQEILPRLTADADAAWLLIQHLPPNFTAIFAKRLNQSCRLNVREAQEGDRLERGTLLMAPGGFHLELDAAGKVRLNQEPTLWGVRPAADVTMRSAAAHFGAKTVGVALTGMGRDGASGVRAIAAAGGVCFAQDEATSVIYGMPRAAIATGAVTHILPLPRMADALLKFIAARNAAQEAGL